MLVCKGGQTSIHIPFIGNLQEIFREKLKNIQKN